MEVNVAYDTFSVNLRPNDESQMKPELSNNYEEADTCMLLLAKQIRDTKIWNIFLNIPNTDVFLTGISGLNQINANLFICTGINNSNHFNFKSEKSSSNETCT